MPEIVSVGNESFESIRTQKSFYVDKTDFIRKWWESRDVATLITRPRRFGKTLNMSMLNCFFSVEYQNRADLFEGLKIWNDKKYRKMQGAYPVILISFADVKQSNYKDAVQKIKNIIVDLYIKHAYLTDWDGLTVVEKAQFHSVDYKMDDVTAQDAVKNLSNYLYRYYGKKTILLLDEYDTPMQEAYLSGYWDEFTAFIRSLFNSAFKTNPYMERALMTGITRVSKESVFSDLNNLNVVTTTSNQYVDSFGFTREEVSQALQKCGLSEQMQDVKKWYDGFIFGKEKEIYNPWSITNFLDKKQFQAYWASTSSNGLINHLIQTSSAEIKEKMEELLKGKTITVSFDEQIVFNQLGQDENAIWSLLLASGYLKAEGMEYREELFETWYQLKITNLEVMGIFSRMFQGWFRTTQFNYHGFMKALIQGDVDAMNHYMNKVSLATFSSFDTGNVPSEYSEPERFYHGFVLGLMVEQAENYEIRSNRESGFGRYDVMLIPKKIQQNKYPAVILEFKVRNPRKEKTLEETVEVALKQIEEKQYDTELIERGIKKEDIRHYGFAFEGKTVLIGERK